MDTKDLVQIKKQRIREELQKLVPPGFNLFPPPKVRGSTYDNLDKFLERDTELLMEVGYLHPTNKGYDTAIQHLRFFGYPISKYKEAENTGSFYNDPQLNTDLREACDYIIRFYDLAEITIKRINDEEDVRLKLLQEQRDKEQKQLEKSQSEQKKEKATKFVSGATQFRPGSKVKIKTTKATGIIPKRSVPQQVLETISKKTETQDEEQNITGSRKLISDLGRVTLQIEQTNNNLNRVIEIIGEDIKNTKEQNRKEVDEYRKRVQDRGRKLGARDLGSSKFDVAGVVKKYVGSFFSGTGGALRALASFNLIERLLAGDFLGAVGPLLSIGATYLPQIGAFVAGLIGKKILKGIFGGGSNKPTRAPRARVTGDAPKVPKLGRFGKIGLGLSALSLGSALLAGRGGEEDKTDQEQRLEQLTQEQKGLVEPEDIKPTAIPQSELARFENLNKKFEQALDFLIKKQKEQELINQNGGRSGPGSTPPSPTTMSFIGGDFPNEIKAFMDLIASQESGGNYEAMYPNTTLPGATDMTISEVARRATGPVGRYQQKPQFLEERARYVGLDPSKDKFSPENQDLITRGHISSLYSGGEKDVVQKLKQDPSIVRRDLEKSTFTGLQKYGEDFNTLFEGRMRQYELNKPSTPDTKKINTPQPVDRKIDNDFGVKKTPIFVPIASGQPPTGTTSTSSVADSSNNPTSVSPGGGVCKFMSDLCKFSSQVVSVWV